MSSDIQVSVEHIPNGGINAQDLASLGAMLAAHGLNQTQVQGLVARMQKMGVQVALATLPSVLEDIRRIQEARIWEMINRIQTLPVMAGYVNRNQVVQILSTIASQTPRQ
jgi:hypothetical protein